MAQPQQSGYDEAIEDIVKNVYQMRESDAWLRNYDNYKAEAEKADTYEEALALVLPTKDVRRGRILTEVQRRGLFSNPENVKMWKNLTFLSFGFILHLKGIVAKREKLVFTLTSGEIQRYGRNALSNFREVMKFLLSGLEEFHRYKGKRVPLTESEKTKRRRAAAIWIPDKLRDFALEKHGISLEDYPAGNVWDSSVLKGIIQHGNTTYRSTGKKLFYLYRDARGEAYEDINDILELQATTVGYLDPEGRYAKKVAPEGMSVIAAVVHSSAIKVPLEKIRHERRLDAEMTTKPFTKEAIRNAPDSLYIETDGGIAYNRNLALMMISACSLSLKTADERTRQLIMEHRDVAIKFATERAAENKLKKRTEPKPRRPKVPAAAAKAKREGAAAARKAKLDAFIKNSKRYLEPEVKQ